MRPPLLLGAGLLVAPGLLLGQSTATEEIRTTRAGVYSEAQVAQGSQLYALNCVSCHPAVTHTGPAFAAKWQGRELFELFSFMRSEMPKSDPGSLADAEYLVLLAYMLKMNGMPAGAQDLPGDSLALKKIRIDFKPDSSQNR